MMAVHPGDRWNESELLPDPVTGREIRRLTMRGWLKQTPTYHTNGGFAEDGEFMVFVSVREARTHLLRAEPATGELLALWSADGVGDRSYIHRGMDVGGPQVNGKGISGNRVTLAPRSGRAILAHGRRITSVDIHTGDERLLLEDCGDQWIFGAPCVPPDEGSVVVALSSAHPQLLRGEPATDDYTEFPGHSLQIARVPMDGSGKLQVLCEHRPAQSAHCAFSPTDGELLYFDMDLPPRYWNGGDGKTPRIWLLDCRTGRARPLKTRYPGPFQVHQAWLWDGSALAYHGPAAGGGVYVGLCTPAGDTLWEAVYPEARHYGHLSPARGRQALILDGDFSPDLLQWLSYDTDQGAASQADPAASRGTAVPRLDTICRHGTEWDTIPGQYSHPHPIADPTGTWVSYNVARNGRTDVYCVRTNDGGTQSGGAG